MRRWLEAGPEADPEEGGRLDPEEFADEIAGHYEELTQRNIPPMDQETRVSALRGTMRRLEERHLRSLKAEEGIKFSELATDLVEDSHHEILAVNQRLKQNQDLRHSLVPDIPK